MAHRIAPRRLLALRNIAAGLALIVAPVLLYLGVAGQAAQAATNTDWTLQAGGTTVCTTFTGSNPSTVSEDGVTAVAWTLSGAPLTCGTALDALFKNNSVPETFTVSRVICSGGTPETQQWVFGGASVRTLQTTEPAPTLTAIFTYQTVAITTPSC
jgi:hypothetical protein